MKIGILGWYYQNNAGDDRILECLSGKLKALGVTDVAVFIAWEELETKIHDINTCDFLLVGGGGLILRNTNRVVDLMERVTIPWGFIGVSIDSVGNDNIDFITYIAKHAKFVVVRDKFSVDIFNNYMDGNLFLAPDLTFLNPYPKASNSGEQGTVALSLRPWKANIFKQYTRNYHRFNKLNHKLPFLSSVLGLWDIKKFLNLVKISTTKRITPFPLHINSKNGDNLLFRDYLNFNEELEFNINDLRNSDYLIGMRLHSLIFATQMGVPFIAVSYANKIDNYLADLGMLEFCVNVNDFKKLPNKIKALQSNRTRIVEMLVSKSDKNQSEINTLLEQIYKTYILC
ncbi:polysaccharide pyruvyl transferase family protein [Formosa sp. A9]|uniref:polysaccharide pyruvyl transferase family protein n=1 Tax=Formosa sp. A9 TaxID=3442641 RepID=UPI003EBF68C9